MNDKSEIFKNNSNLVPHTLKTYFPMIYADKNRNEDYLQFGYMKLWELIGRYDKSKNCSFSTFAISNLIGYFKQYSKKESGIKYDRDTLNKIYEFINECKKCKIDINDEIEVSSLLEKINASYKEKIGILNFIFYHNSLDKEIQIDDSTYTLNELLPSINDIEHEIETKNLIECITRDKKDKTQKTKEIINLLLLGYNQNQISKILNVSRETIRKRIDKLKIKIINEFIQSNDYDLALNLIKLTFKDKKFTYEDCVDNRIKINLIPNNKLNNFFK